MQPPSEQLAAPGVIERGAHLTLAILWRLCGRKGGPPTGFIKIQCDESHAKLLHNYGKSPFLMGKSIINCHFQ